MPTSYYTPGVRGILLGAAAVLLSLPVLSATAEAQQKRKRRLPVVGQIQSLTVEDEAGTELHLLIESGDPVSVTELVAKNKRAKALLESLQAGAQQVQFSRLIRRKIKRENRIVYKVPGNTRVTEHLSGASTAAPTENGARNLAFVRVHLRGSTVSCPRTHLAHLA